MLLASWITNTIMSQQQEQVATRNHPNVFISNCKAYHGLLTKIRGMHHTETTLSRGVVGSEGEYWYCLLLLLLLLGRSIEHKLELVKLYSVFVLYCFFFHPFFFEIILVSHSNYTHIISTDIHTSGSDFVQYSKRLGRILVEDALTVLPTEPIGVETPCGHYAGIMIPSIETNNICAVSILRAGNALLESVKDCLPGIPIGYLLLQRDETSPEKAAKHYYTKLPTNIHQNVVLLCDPLVRENESTYFLFKVVSYCVTYYAILLLIMDAYMTDRNRWFCYCCHWHITIERGPTCKYPLYIYYIGTGRVTGTCS